jgi:Ulp1 family protease
MSKESEYNCASVESVPSEAAPISTPSAIQEILSIDCSQITKVTVLDPQYERLEPLSKPSSAVACSRLRKKLEISQNTSPDKDNVMRSRLRKRKLKTIPMNNPTVDGPKKKEVAKTTSQSTAEKKGTVSHPIVINDNDITLNSDANSHLFKFKKKHSGEEMLKHILECKYVSRSSKLNGKIAFYAFSDGITRSHEILYSDFTRFVNKDWVSDNVVNTFFKRMDLEYGHNAKISRFGTSFMWDSYIGNEYYPLSKLWSKLAMGNVHESLHDLYLPILVLKNHWILAVVNFTDKQIDIYNSMDSQHRHITKTMVQRFSPMFRDQNVWHMNDHYLDVSV